MQTLDIALDFAYWLMGTAVAIAFLRLAQGPTQTDRVIALDLISGLSLGVAVLLAIETRNRAYLDIALSIALLSFLGTLALARYVREGVER